MNEQALNYSYELFKKDGYTGTLDQYKQLISSDKQALDYSFNLFKNDGYSGSIDDFNGLISPMAERPAEPVKKKDTVSPFVDGGSELTKFDPSTGKVVQETPDFTKPKEKDFSGLEVKVQDEKILTKQPRQEKPLVATESTKVVSPKTVQPVESEKKGAKSYLENIAINLGLGASYANEAVASIPESIINILAIPQNYIAEKTGLPIGVTAEGIKESWGITNPLLDYVKEDQKILSGEVSKFIADRYEDPSIVGNFEKGNYQEGFELLGSAITQSLPVSVGLMIGGAYTAPSKLATVATLGFTEDQRESLAEMDPTMSEAEKTLKAAGMAGAESVFSSIGTATIGKVYRDIAKREGTEAAKGILRDGLVQTYKKALEKSGVVAGFVGEGIEEAATQITQNVISGRPAFEGAADAFVTGAGSGVVFTAPISAVNAKRYIDNKITSYDTKTKVTDILKDKADNIGQIYNVPVSSEISTTQLDIANLPNSRDLLVNDLKKSVSRGDIGIEGAKQSLFVFDKVQQVSNSVKDLNISNEDKATVATLLRQRDDLKTKIQNKDDVLVVQEKKQIEDINNQIQQILLTPQQDAIQEQAAGEVPVQPGATVSQEVAQGEPQAEPQGVAEEGQAQEEVTPETKTTSEFADELSNKYGVELELQDNQTDNSISVPKIVVPKDQRNTGLGTKVMEEVVQFADRAGKRLVLTPSTSFGGSSVKRLVDFYKSIGFVENKGKNKDFTIRDSMYRNPVSPTQEVDFTEEEVAELEKAVSRNLPEYFQLATKKESPERMAVLTDAATKLMDEVQPEIVEESDVVQEPSMETIPITVTENLELANKVPKMSVKDLVGKKVNYVMADQLKVDDKLMGGPFFPLMDDTFGKVAWASMDEDAAKNIIRGFIKGDYSVVYNMSPSAIDSNIATLNEFVKRLNSIPDSENVYPQMAEYLKGRKFGKDTKAIQDLVDNSSNLESFIDGFKSLNVDQKQAIIKAVLPSKSVNATTKLGSTLQNNNITQESVRESISEQFARDLPMGAMTMVLEITDAEGNPIRSEADIDKAIMTREQQAAEGIRSHKNYPVYIRGRAVAMLKDTVPVWNVSSRALDTMNKKYAGIIQKKVPQAEGVAEGTPETRKQSSAEIRADEMYTLQRSSTKAEVVSQPINTQYQSFVNRLSKAIPSVEIVSSQEEFNNLMNDLNSKKLATKDQKIYGAVLNGKLYLNPGLENFNTPIHEFGHVWMNASKELSPDIYNKGIDLIQNSEYVSQVEENPEYSRVTKKMKEDGMTDDQIRQYILEEALATAIGDKGESFVNASQKRNFKNWLNELFQFIKKLTGISKLTPEQIQNLDLDKFLNSVVVDLLSENPIFKNAEVNNLNNQLQLMAKPDLKADDIVKIGLANGFSVPAIKELLSRRGFTQGAIDIALGKTKPTVKKAPSAEKIVGKPAKKKVTVDEMAALKDQIKLEARAAREAKGDLNAKRKALAAKVSALEGKGTVTTNQVKSIVKRIEKTNLDNPIIVDRLLEYIEKVFDNANYAADMDEIRKLQAQAKSRNHTSMNSLVNEFTSINPEDIPLVDKETGEPLNKIMEYKEALDFLNTRTPFYGKMNEVFDEMLSYKKAEKFDAVKTKDALIDKYKSIMDKYVGKEKTGKENIEEEDDKLKTVEDYVALIKDLNAFKRKAFQLLQNEAIKQDEYEDLINGAGKTQAVIDRKFAEPIAKIKNGLIADIKNQRPKPNPNFTKEQNDLIKEYLQLNDSDIEKLSPEDLFILNDLLDNISNGEIDYYRLSDIVSRAAGKQEGVAVGKQLKGSKVSLGSAKLREEMAKFESAFWEGLLGLGRATSGPLQKFIISPFNRAIGSYEKFNRDGFNDFLNLKKKYKIDRFDPLNKSKDMHKIGMLTTYLQEHMAQFDPKNKGVKDIGKRDWFKEILDTETMRDDYSPEELKIIEEIYKTLPKDKDGNVNPKAVFDSYEANDGKFFTKNQKAFFDSIMEWKKQNSTGKQKAANEMSGNAFKEIPFHMLRSRYGSMSSQITPTTSGDNGMVRINAGTGKERVSEAVGPINTNFEKLFIKGLEQTGRDFFLTKALKDINNVLASAKKELDGDKDPLLKAISYTLSDALSYEFSNTASQNILKRLVQARAAMTLLDPIRTGIEFTSTLLSFGLRARTLSGYKNLFGSQGDMKNLLEFTDSPMRLRQNINNAIDINDGKIEKQSMLTKWTTFLSGLPERTMMVTSWMPTFTSEFQNITKEKFDMKKFNDSEAYREKYGKAIKEASAVADAQTEKIIGPTTKAGQRREILIFPGKTVGRDTVSGQILGFFSNYPYRESTEFVNGFKEAGEVLKKGDSVEAISQLQKPLGIALNVAAYGFLSSVVYASRLILLGDDDEEERGTKLLEELMTAKGFIEETAANAAALAASKYAGGGRAILQVLGTLGMALADDEETKATIKKMLKGSVYVDPLPTQKLTGYGTADKVNTAIIKYIPQFVVLSNTIIDGIGGVNEVKAIYDKVESKGIDALTKDEELKVLALSVMFTATQLFLNYRGTSLPSYNNLKAGMKTIKEDTGVADIADGNVPAKKKKSSSRGGGGGRTKTINKTDLKKYNRELYNQMYGPGSAAAEIEKEVKDFEKEQREFKKKMKDQVYGGD